MKSHADVAVIGGGVLGCSVLYHLACQGVTDTILLEKDELTSGTTFHSAALCTHYASTESLIRLHKRTTEIYQELEAATGQAAGFHACGSIRLAHSRDELADCRRFVAMARYLNVPALLLTPGDIKEVHPLVSLEGVIAALVTPADGYTDPAMTTNAFARGARKRGAVIATQVSVLGLRPSSGGAWRVETNQGVLIAERIVNAAGMWATKIAALAGFYLPVVPVALQYLLTEPVPELAAPHRELPVLRGIEPPFYIREQSGGLLVGLYERECQFWARGGIPADFSRSLLPSDLTRIEEGITAAIRNVPSLVRVGVRHEICGPSSRVPDNLGLLGPIAGLPNFYVIAGFSGGFVEGGGAGEQLAEWIVHGAPSVDMGAFDPRRFATDLGPARTYAMVAESYTFGYAVAYPNVERQAGRPVKTSPIHHRLAARGAHFGARNGWECPLYFEAGPTYQAPSFQRRPWFESVGRECRAVHERVGILDLASEAKYEVTGGNARYLLDRVFATELPGTNDTAAEAVMLTPRGGIAGRMTVARLGSEHYYLTAPAAAETHHFDRLCRAAQTMPGVSIGNVTGRKAVLVISGPHSRALLAQVSGVDISASGWPRWSLRKIELGLASTLALRTDAHGEEGYELHHPMEYHSAIYEALQEVGRHHGLLDIGIRASQSMMLEVGYPRWPRDITEEDSLPAAGLDDRTTVKDCAFIGREALLDQRRSATTRRLTLLEIEGSEIDPWGDEPVFDGEAPAALLRSAGYGHRIGRAVGLAYLPCRLALPGTCLGVEILGRRYAAVVRRPELSAAVVSAE